MSVYIPSSDAANVLVNDIGSSVGDYPTELPRYGLSVATNLSNAITNDTTSNKTLFWGVRSEDALNQRFGSPSDPKNVSKPWNAGKWTCQATSFIKSCSVEGYLGNSQVYKESVDLRVYREIVPSAAGYWNAYEESRATKPILPYYWQLPGGNYGSGSIPLQNGICTNSFWNVLFVGWADEKGAKRFALIDYYPIYLVTDTFRQEQYTTAVSNMSAKPQNTFGASTPAGWVQNFIKNNYHSGGSVSGGEGSSGQGRILLPKIPGQETTKYYLTDDSLKSQMKEQSSKLPTRVASSTTDKPVVYTGDKIILTDIVVDPEYILYYKPPGTQYQYSPKGSSIVYTSFHMEIGGAKKQILATETTHTELENLKLDMKVSGTNAALITVDGITLTHGLNYVKQNLEFLDGNVTITNWGVSKHGTNDKYFNGHVVDGATISGSQQNSIEGVITGSEARSAYYYVLPGFQRVVQGGTVIHRDLVETANDASVAIVLGDLAQKGRHGGKFLKSAGFTTTGIGKYRDAQEAKLKDGALSNLATKIFNGYFYGFNSPVPYGKTASYTYSFQFNLKGYPGLPASSSSYPSYPSYPGYPGGTGSSTTDTSAADRAKYLKVINDAKSTLASGANVSFDTLSKNLLSLGIPLSAIRDEVLKGLEAGKIAYLMRTRRYTLETAKLEWQKDPLYLAINKFFTASSSSQTSSSSPSANGGNKDKNKNKNKNGNKNGGNADTAGASSQNETIKITVTRGLAGYVKGVRSTGNTRSRPTLIQTYEGMKSSKQINGTPIRSFEFPFVPSQVNYTGLGINWTEIERTGSYPIVDWSSFQLLKISFNFDIVSMAQQNQAGFGLYYSCEDQIMELREMAQAPYPVTFLNMDKFMQDEIRWPSLNTGRGIEFVIQEFSVTATQRTSSNPTALVSSTVPNQISRASCTMTLQEIPIEQVDIVQMPPIKPCKKECDKDKIIKQEDSKHPLFSTTITQA